MTADLSLYDHFVASVTSETSTNLDAWVNRLHDLQNAGINPALLMTGATGLAGESGEFSELVKKLNWHGKDLTPEVHKHMEKELGDIIFYWMMSCQSLDLDPNDVIKQNVAKLEARYPEGSFSVDRAENRADGDV
jgi:NTP pyrophosphatase (non-canonical NTP hydrolase)|tara:strand:- start:2198 stop:2602 length:405 start_codon:yes stop_codon:yes gene_type:complete